MLRLRLSFALAVLAHLHAWPTSARGQDAAPEPEPEPQSEPQPEAELVVSGKRPEVAQTTVDAEEMRVMPGAFGDPFRTVEALPSATPIVSGLPYFYLRGAAPNQNAFYLDGIRVPLLYHVGLAAGVIHAGLVEQIDVFASAPPASYGGVIGAIVAGQTRPAENRFRGEANLRLVDVGTLLETPVGSDRHTLLVAGHYGYPGPILSAVTDEVDLDYWDYQVRASWRVSDRGTLGVFGFGSHDYLATGDPLREDFVSDFHRVDLRYDHAFSGGSLRVGVTGGYDDRGASPSYLTDHSAAARLELSLKLTEGLRLRTGAVARFDDYGFRHRVQDDDSNQPDVPSSVDPPPINLSAGAHADVVWRVAPALEIVPGARFDVYSTTRAVEPGARRETTSTVPAVDPRLAVRVGLMPTIDMITTAGLAHQFPSLRVGDVPGPIANGEGFAPGSRRLQSAAHASHGFELSLPEDFSASATGFYSAFWGMTDLTASCYELIQPVTGPMEGPPPPGPVFCPGDEPVRGHAYGFELLLKRSLYQRLSGQLSYALSRSRRTARFPTLEGDEVRATVPSEFDRTHVLNAALGLDMGAGWRAGTRFVFYTGAPYSALSGSIPVPPYHALRGPAFFRLDVRLEKRWILAEDAFIAFVAEGLNVTLSRETSTLGQDCDGRFGPDGGTNVCRLSKPPPITVPSLGVEAAF